MVNTWHGQILNPVGRGGVDVDGVAIGVQDFPMGNVCIVGLLLTRSALVAGVE